MFSSLCSRLRFWRRNIGTVGRWRLHGTPRLLRRCAPRGLLGRSLLILVAPLILLQVVTSVIFYDRHWDTVMRRLADGVAGDVGAVLDLADEMDFDRVSSFSRMYFSFSLNMEAGAVLPNQPPPDSSAFSLMLARQMEERLARPVVVQADLFSSDVTVDIQLPEGVLHLSLPRKRLYSSTTYIFVLWMVGASMILFGIATIFMSNQVRSIRRLAEAADGFGKGRDVPPIKPEGAREVRLAAQAFNLMQQRIQRQVAQRTEMLAGVSHDLRTPLTRMKLQLAMMEETPDIADLNADLDEMQRMIDGYLAFARGEGTEEVSAVDLFDLLLDLGQRFNRGHDRERVRVDLPPLPEEDWPILFVRSNAIERCLSNIIGNALRYGQTVQIQSQILSEELVSHPSEPTIEVLIDDDGPGIPPPLREDVFRPFFRGEPSRNSSTGGIGLGLTIARDVVRVHGGDIALEDSPQLGGLRVRLSFPL